MRLLVDMNLAPRWIPVLEAAGYESFHWSTVGAHDASDRLIMAHAAERDCVVLTHDLDFGAILAATHGEKPSVVQIRAADVTPEAIGLQVVATLRQMTAELEQGALVVLDATRARLRLLPLRSKT